MRALPILAAALLVAATVARAAHADEIGRYVVRDATILVGGELAGGTVLLDTATGSTWMLVNIEGHGVRWQAVPFGEYKEKLATAPEELKRPR